MLRNKSLVGGLGCFLFALAYFWEARGLPTGSIARPGIGFVPDLLAKIALLLSAALVVASWFKARQADEKEPAANFDGGSGPWLIAALLVAYPLALELLGFFPATIPLFFVSLLVMDNRNRLTALAISAGMVILAYCVFSVAAGVRFPAGVFG